MDSDDIDLHFGLARPLDGAYKESLREGRRRRLEGDRQGVFQEPGGEKRGAVGDLRAIDMQAVGGEFEASVRGKVFYMTETTAPE